MKEIFDKRYPVTSFFLLVTALVFLLMLVLTGLNFERADTLLQFGAMYGPIIRLFPEQIWRLFSAIFVHIGWEHFIVNMISLYFLGRQVEEIFGLFAAIIVLRYATRNPYIQQLGQSYLTLFVINIIGSVLIPGISLAGHIGGAVGGAFLAVIFPVKWERRMYSTSQRIGATVLFIALAIFLCYKGMNYV